MKKAKPTTRKSKEKNNMEDFFENFLNGDEVKSIKLHLKALTTAEIVFAIICFLVFLVLLPKLTLAASLVTIASLVLTHLVNKWKKTA